MNRVVPTALLVSCGWLANPSPAAAHIDLIAPTPRVRGIPDSTLSVPPCGQREDSRLEDKASVFRPGETIDVVWDVYVQHVSYFRLAFDADGDDSFSTRSTMPSDPTADDPTGLPAGEGETILYYLEDRTGDIDHVEQRVRLPSVACERCTLQLIQFTYGLPIREATYHQCADLVLEGSPVVSSEAPVSDANGRDALEPGGESGCALSAAGSAGSRHGVHAWLAMPLVSAWRRWQAALAGRRRRVSPRAGKRGLPGPTKRRSMKGRASVGSRFDAVGTGS